MLALQCMWPRVDAGNYISPYKSLLVKAGTDHLCFPHLIHAAHSKRADSPGSHHPVTGSAWSSVSVRSVPSMLPGEARQPGSGAPCQTRALHVSGETPAHGYPRAPPTRLSKHIRMATDSDDFFKVNDTVNHTLLLRLWARLRSMFLCPSFLSSLALFVLSLIECWLFHRVCKRSSSGLLLTAMIPDSSLVNTWC